MKFHGLNYGLELYTAAKGCFFVDFILVIYQYYAQLSKDHQNLRILPAKVIIQFVVLIF